MHADADSDRIRSADDGASTRELVRLVQQGDRGALDALVERHRPWIYNVALRMVYLPQDADDATQEILIKVVTKLVVVRRAQQPAHVALPDRGQPPAQHAAHRAEEVGYTFDRYAEGLDSAPDLELPDPSTVPADVQLLVDEARIGCSMGMLLCLDREQRLVYVLGEIFGVTDVVGAELLEVSRDAFRPAAVARAPRSAPVHGPQVRAGERGQPVPLRAQDAGVHQRGVRRSSATCCSPRPTSRASASSRRSFTRTSTPSTPRYAAVHRDHPFQTPPALAGAIRTLLRQPAFESILDGPRDAAAKGDA